MCSGTTSTSNFEIFSFYFSLKDLLFAFGYLIEIIASSKTSSCVDYA
jgi:hypothetical protein